MNNGTESGFNAGPKSKTKVISGVADIAAIGGIANSTGAFAFLIPFGATIDPTRAELSFLNNPTFDGYLSYNNCYVSNIAVQATGVYIEVTATGASAGRSWANILGKLLWNSNTSSYLVIPLNRLFWQVTVY